MTGFDRFIAIDWSGAKGAYAGVAVAECGPGSSAPDLVAPPSASRWTRQKVEDWLRSRLGERERLLIGIDCAFSLPWSRAAGYGVAHGPGLWAQVDRICDAAPDHFAEAFTRHAACDGHFWAVGKKPAHYVLAHRRTEDACRQAGLGAPESPYKLIGPKQVGKGALAGMRLLHRLRDGCDALRVWPFEDISGRSTIVEIYPRLFLNKAGFGSAKVRSLEDLNACLSRLGSKPAGLVGRDLTDHETDALVSAAGLRLLAGDQGLWQVPEAKKEELRREGWIFAVPHNEGAP